MGYLCFNCGTRFPTQKNIDQHNCEEEINKRERGDSVNDNLCQTCQKTFSKPYNLTKHRKRCRIKNETKRLHCKCCSKTFTSYTNRSRHEKKCTLDNGKASDPSPPASECSNATPEDDPSNKHVVKCGKCGFKCSIASELYAHRMDQHSQGESSSYQESPWEKSGKPPWERDDGSVDDAMRLVYNRHRHLILKKKVTEQTAVTRYNFPVSNDMSINDFKNHIEEIYENNSNAFKINLTFGIILRHIETGKYRYFTPYSNETLFDLPLLISRRLDIVYYMQKLSELDVISYMLRQRPDTSWKPVTVCNVVYTLFKTSFVLGTGRILPNFIKKRKSIFSLECDPHHGKPYDDNLCMFRCLAYHEIKNVNALEKLTKNYFDRWLLYVEQHKIRNSDICVANIAHVEACFQINIHVFSLKKDKTCVGVYKSMEKFPDKPMYLNLYENHLSYISNFNTYASKYHCSVCEKLFPNVIRLKRHSKTCENKTKIRLPGGYYKHLKTIFDQLEEWNIFVAPEKRYFPWFGVYDFEAILVPEEQPENQNRKFVNSHKAICVCLCSNVAGFEKEKFILNENKNDLLEEMCEYLTLVSDESRRLAQSRWGDVFLALNKLENKWSALKELATASDSGRQKTEVDDATDSDVDLNLNEARESDVFEPPSVEFLEKVSKENVWYRFMRDLSENNTSNVTYNNWDESGSDEDNEIESSYSGFQTLHRHNASSDSDDAGEYDVVVSERDKRRIFESDEDDDNDMVGTRLTVKNKRRRSDGEDDHLDVDADDARDDVADTINITHFPEVANTMMKKIRRIKHDFESYCEQLPVLGFNSGKYDINLIKNELAIQLGLHKSGGRKFVIKKNNNYTCIANARLRFLDMCNYLPPGTSYDSFLVSFNVPVRKSFFPYEYFTDVSKLREPYLPGPECFFSKLKDCNTLENKTFLKYQRLVECENKSPEEALKILKLNTAPSSTIGENYAKLENIWKEKNMKTLRDFLQYYAELDVGPMVQGVQNYQEFFFNKGLDVFKDFISVPGIARKMLYQCGLKNGASFGLFDSFDVDLYETFMKNMTGGPSIIFTRRHQVGETLIRSDKDKLCRSILGYDANSLYLYAICQNMPVGRYIRRKSANAFRPENRVKRYYAMYDWMNWVSFSTGKSIKHKMNDGREFRVGPYYIDGKSDANNLWEFFGCYWHGCINCLNVKDEKREIKYKATLERLDFLKAQGFRVNTIWECEYRKQLKENPEMRLFVQNSMPTFYRNHPSSVTREDILDGVMKEELFGFVEVDIEIPESWDQVDYKPKTDLTPYEYFKEMCPLFVTSDVPFECIGKHMQEHAKTFNLSQKSRTLLVGGLRAKNMLVMTPLLKWYIELGMRIKHIHQVVEFSKQACFEEFGKQVADARREGDADEKKQVIALLFKLIGNSAFGGTILNKEKQKRHKYVRGFKNACLEINNPRFSSMIEFEHEYFEMEFKKGRIDIDNPIVLGIAILNYAKLHFDFITIF